MYQYLNWEWLDSLSAHFTLQIAIILIIFQITEYMLGSVLCSPGCFTIYRASALVDVLPEYASQVKEAFEFLIKEMGEDRYLTVLMVKECKRAQTKCI